MSIGVSKEMADAFRALEPGQAIKLVLKDGREFAVIAWEDMEHILSTAHMDVNVTNIPVQKKETL